MVTSSQQSRCHRHRQSSRRSFSVQTDPVFCFKSSTIRQAALWPGQSFRPVKAGPAVVSTPCHMTFAGGNREGGFAGTFIFIFCSQALVEFPASGRTTQTSKPSTTQVTLHIFQDTVSLPCSGWLFRPLANMALVSRRTRAWALLKFYYRAPPLAGEVTMVR
jgi:hypothetical protein